MSNLENLTDTEIRSLLWRYNWFVDVKIEAYKRNMVNINSIAHFVLNGYSIITKVCTQIETNNVALIDAKVNAIEDYVEDISIESVVEDKELITETLAQIYCQQGLYNKAIDTYRQLILKYPKKSVYFASQITEIENKFY